MSKCKDLTGLVFGYLTVISRAANTKSGEARWNCLCTCGKQKVICGYNLRNGITKSCGCLVSEKTSEFNTTHGMSKTRIYRTYKHMKERCYSKTDKRYSEYGGRGISVCDEWKNDFMSFYNWAMNNGYKDNLTIDRIDVNGNYEPGNCRWATWKEQENNRRNNRLITYNGQTKTAMEWSEICGIHSLTIIKRLNSGWNVKDSLFKPVRKRGIVCD